MLFLNNPQGLIMIQFFDIEQISINMIRLGVLITIIVIASTAPENEKFTKVPGFAESFNTSVYRGYLNLQSSEREAYYVFVESEKGASNSDPVTLWLNGGPGCSSLLGFLQQIGPFYLQEGKNYKMGDNLTENPHSWHKISNLLFLETPAGVGYSYNTNTNFTYNDAIVANDNLNALLDFFKKFPEYTKNGFWLAGESYAGKYIPDLAVLIDQYNQFNESKTFKINMKGLMIGNGVMTFETLSRSQVEFLYDRSFVNPEIKSYWDYGCQYDPQSAGCAFFVLNFQNDIDELNPYNVYSYCYYNDSFGNEAKRPHITQESILMNIKSKLEDIPFSELKFNGPVCSYFDGMFNYFNLHEEEYKAKFPMQLWNGPCADNITYQSDRQGSMHSYRYLLGRVQAENYQIHLYNGNWDVAVPYMDTKRNLETLNLVESYLYTPWFTGDQHSGFMQIYSGVIFTVVKGGSHMLPQSKRPEALNLFNMTLSGHTGKLMKEAKEAANKSMTNDM